MADAYGSARDRLGRTLAGKYHLREVLGVGGTAVVYRATSPELGEVAVKVLHDHLSRIEEVCRRFIREGSVGNVINHPRIVRVLDSGETPEDGTPFLVIELLEGESLEERRVAAGGRLDMWEVLDFADQILEVLEVAHAKNIIHRDIKPANLFVTKSGMLKVLDFGIARLTEDRSVTSTKTGQTVGTPAFMPPEQALSRPREIDARTDIWALGATLFTLLSGEHVHIAETTSEHLVKAATLHARSLARALPGIPSNVELLVAKALAFDKTERWVSATAMREQLATVRDDPGRRVGTTSMPPPDRSSPSESNMPTLVHADRRAEIERERARSSERVRNSDHAAMSISQGEDRPRRRWVLPLAVASTFLLVVMSIVLLIMVSQPNATRNTGGATNARAAATAPIPTLPPSNTDSRNEIPDPPPPSDIDPPAPAAIPTGAPVPSPILTSPAKPTAPPPPPVAPKKPAPSAAPNPAATNNVYRPF